MSVQEPDLNSTEAAVAPRRQIALSAVIRDFGLVAAVLALVVSLSIASPNFLSVDNFMNILNQNAYVAITAFGATLVIIAGGFDLSVGAIYAFTGVASAWLALHVGTPAALALVVLAGAAFGCANGLASRLLRAHPFLVTLATGVIISGFSVGISGGFLINASDVAGFTTIGTTAVAGIPSPVVIMIVVGIALTFLLRSTAYGRYVYAVGANPRAARVSGVRVGAVIVTTFVVSGVCAALAGLAEVTKSGVGQADASGASGLALGAIAAVIVGGTSIKGGQGAIWRTAVGVLLLALVQNGLNLLNAAPHYRDIISGLVMIVAVGLNALASDARS